MAEPKTTNLGLNLSHPTSPDVRGEWPASMDENLQLIDAAVGGGGGGASIAPILDLSGTTDVTDFGSSSGNNGDTLISLGTGNGVQWVAPTVQKKTVIVEAAQITNLHATPVELIAAPGAGKMIQVISAVLQYVFGTTPFTVGGDADLSVFYGNDPGSDTSAISTGPGQLAFLDQSANMVASEISNQNPYTQAAVENKAICLLNTDATDASDGDGTLFVTLAYIVIDL